MKKNNFNRSTRFLGVLALSITLVQCGTSSNSGTVEPVSSDDVSYEADIEPILSNYCVSCHGGNSPAAGFNATTYESVRNMTENGPLLKRINDHANPMPQSGLLPKYMRATFANWAKGGYLKSQPMATDETKLNYDPVPRKTIEAIDINEKGFDLLEKMQGHWVGKIHIMSMKYDWFAFDYRAIGPSHVHGIYEGGTMGNLFTSFFVADYKGTRTIMARNGGILNGIYRTSYFVLDKVEHRGDESYYRLVDEYGGDDIMFIELTFKGDKLHFSSRTSTFGTYPQPRRHMDFEATRMHMELAEEAAQEVGFPQNVVDFDFSEGLPDSDWGDANPQTSASYMWEGQDMKLEELAKLARDPYPLEKVPYVASLDINVEVNELIKNKRLLVYLSKYPLTDQSGKLIMEYGYPKQEVFDGVLSFPELDPGQTKFEFTYLHPGNYYLTVVADMNDNHVPSKGDISHKSIAIEVGPKSSQSVNITGVRVQN